MPAACCAMQNVQLAAWDAGVGMQWSTGRITLEEQTYQLLGIDSSQEYIIGFFYTGYPADIGRTETATGWRVYSLGGIMQR